jgi:hypothetical protein
MVGVIYVPAAFLGCSDVEFFVDPDSVKDPTFQVNPDLDSGVLKKILQKKFSDLF